MSWLVGYGVKMLMWISFANVRVFRQHSSGVNNCLSFDEFLTAAFHLRSLSEIMNTTRPDFRREVGGGFLRFLPLAMSVFFFHGIAAVFTEAVYRVPGMIYGWVYVLLEFIAYPTLVVVEVAFTYPAARRRVLVKKFREAMGDVFEEIFRNSKTKNFERLHFNARVAALAGISQVFSHGCSSAALAYVNITYATLLKASKVHIFFATHLVLHPRDRLPRAGEFWGASILFLGLVFFGWGEQAGVRVDYLAENAKGFFSGPVLMLVVGNCLSSVTRDFQEQVMQQTGTTTTSTKRSPQHDVQLPQGDDPTRRGQAEDENLAKERPSQEEPLDDVALDMLVKLLILVQHVFAIVLVLVWVLYTGELQEFFRVVISEAEEPITFASASTAEHMLESFPPWVPLVGFMLADNVLTYIGLKAIFVLQREFDASVATAVCTCRKAVTFFLSFLLFPKALTELHVLGLVLVVVGGGIFFHFGERRRRGGVVDGSVVGTMSPSFDGLWAGAGAGGGLSSGGGQEHQRAVLGGSGAGTSSRVVEGSAQGGGHAEDAAGARRRRV